MANGRISGPDSAGIGGAIGDAGESASIEAPGVPATIPFAVAGPDSPNPAESVAPPTLESINR
jgi:hypothetical protein